MAYEVMATETFRVLYGDLDQSERQWIDKVKLKLRENPTGKVLRFNWFREKKYLNKRLYYLVDDISKRILLVSFASKKEQQKEINLILRNMEDLMKSLKLQT